MSMFVGFWAAIRAQPTQSPGELICRWITNTKPTDFRHLNDVLSTAESRVFVDRIPHHLSTYRKGACGIDKWIENIKTATN